MDFITLAKQRYSCREYLDRPVAQETLDLILEAGRVAPTGCNRQPFHLYVIRGVQMERLNRACRTFGAPLAILVCADREQGWIRPNDGRRIGDIDASILTDHMMLEATEQGLGSVWVCNFKPKVLREEFHLPDHLEPVNVLILGYAAAPAASPERHAEQRKPISDLVTYA